MPENRSLMIISHLPKFLDCNCKADRNDSSLPCQAPRLAPKPISTSELSTRIVGANVRVFGCALRAKYAAVCFLHVSFAVLVQPRDLFERDGKAVAGA